MKIYFITTSYSAQIYFIITSYICSMDGYDGELWTLSSAQFAIWSQYRAVGIVIIVITVIFVIIEAVLYWGSQQPV